MPQSDIILKYFPELTAGQIDQFNAMGELYPEWNEKINVISRKDIDNLYVNHILHSLAIAKFLGPLEAGTTFMDLGTGGGFPGIPLAVMYPDCRFHLIDRIAKKLRVAADVAEKIGLKNVTFRHGDVGECHDRFNYVVSRAVMPLDKLVKLVVRNISPVSAPANLYSNGLVCLKGGDLAEESRGVQYPVVEFNLNEFLSEPYYDTKKLVYVPINKK
ncbi:MAG: 16S rRNA (guanine(527)-N(7))-methyltransferase RsmG [Muribaculaceae bacterium]|uniref:16S rRNA (guanine(527)-N(7))-methyltransferase RsmG n=1 Tax=uncultured Duncaniella sp. TaxID=2768039 RepID=UPI002616770C|nr:RsmG family class I SAM-dependent methyltransferase [uncultured Duncaniella sp.]MCI9053717.1 16S rRNA (guanine(527)-N(7))-methyltransferase RsmG [Muribaculaceae bacterium]